jgi:prepilin-type N-terminal cleavage/methylation domain-containing protein
MRGSVSFSTDNIHVLRDSLRDVKGLSLLEVLIAIIILAIALSSISYFFSTARSNIEAAGHMRCGLVLAQDKLEELKDLGYFHADLSEGTQSDRVTSTRESAADGEFYREWIVTPVPDPANGTDEPMDYKLVELKVYDQRLSPAEALNHDNKLVAELSTYISP